MVAENNLLFCICVPVYKTEKYIRECIESVLNQSYQNFKLILVDDGSPDNSGAICDEFACTDRRIKVIHKKNMGALAAREDAINYAQTSCSIKGAYVMFLDSDDTLKSNALERLADVIRCENCDMVIFGMDRVSEGKVVVPFNDKNQKSYMEQDKRLLYKKVFSDWSFNPLCRKAIRAELIPTKNYEQYYKFAHGEDLLRSIDLYKTMSTVYFLQEGLYNYTINPDSITQTVSPDNFKVDFTIRELVHEFLIAENIFTTEDWLEYRGVCVSLINDMATTIGRFAISSQEKNQFYRQIAESDYYKNNLRGQRFKVNLRNRIAFRFFESNAYWAFNIYGRIINFRAKNKQSASAE